MTGDSRLRLRYNPVRLAFSASPWRAAGYLLTYLVVSGVLFAACLAASTLAAVFALTVAAVPLLIALAAVIRGCAGTQRWMLRQVYAGPVRGRHLAPTGQGLMRRARAQWTSGGTWRDLGLLVGLWPPMFALSAVVFYAWALLLAGVTMPVWYWAARGTCAGDCQASRARGILLGHFPNGPHGPGAWGLYVHTLPTALLAAAGFAVLFLLANYLLVGTARVHARVMRALLREPGDPLAPARDVLASPGPLGPLGTARSC
jgi:hypothetical protein